MDPAHPNLTIKVAKRAIQNVHNKRSGSSGTLDSTHLTSVEKETHLRSMNTAQSIGKISHNKNKTRNTISKSVESITEEIASNQPTAKFTILASSSSDTPKNSPGTPTLSTTAHNASVFSQYFDILASQTPDQSNQHISDFLQNVNSAKKAKLTSTVFPDGSGSPQLAHEMEVEEVPPFSEDLDVFFHFIDNNVILQMKNSSVLHFNGQIFIQVMKGTVDIQGYKLTPSSGPLTLFSTKGLSWMSLNASLPANGEGGFIHSLESMQLDECKVESLLKSGAENDCWILLKKSSSSLPLFIEHYSKVKLFQQPSKNKQDSNSRKAEKKLDCVFQLDSLPKLWTKGDTWDSITQNVLDSSNDGCSVLCGGKGVGKSTLLRYLVNRLLSHGQEGVIVLDFDPGQSELSVPGCLSMSVIRKPLLGPNFTNQQDPEWSLFLGDVNVVKCSQRYLTASFMLIEYWLSKYRESGYPCVVNTMGFCKGLGVILNAKLISMLQPALVVQIQSRSSSRNFPDKLSPELVRKNCSSPPFLCEKSSYNRISSSLNLRYELLIVDSVSEKSSQDQSWGFDGRMLREINILSYLSRTAYSPNYSFLEIVPYTCPLDKLYVCVCHEPVPNNLILSVMNGSLVALCSANPAPHETEKGSQPGLPVIIRNSPILPCLGFGVVRGIDPETRLLYLVSPIPLEKLSSVNCLALGAVHLPDSLRLSPPCSLGTVPYVVKGRVQDTARSTKRNFRPNLLRV